jgi:hypothetical protein
LSRCAPSKLAKSVNKTPKIFISPSFDMGVKNAQFDDHFKSGEKSVKSPLKKSFA